MCGERSLLCCCVYKPAFRFPTILAAIEGHDEGTVGTTTKTQRRHILDYVRIVTQKETFLFADHQSRYRCCRIQQFCCFFKIQKRGVIGAAFPIENTNCDVILWELYISSAQSRRSTLICSPGNAPDKLFRLKRAQQTAAKIGQKTQFPIAAD